MSPKTPSMTTLNIPRPSPDAGSTAPADFASQWQAARLVYPLYAALANDKLTSAGATLPSWQDALSRYYRLRAGATAR